jgi:hypothetical protein
MPGRCTYLCVRQAFRTARHIVPYDAFTTTYPTERVEVRSYCTCDYLLDYSIRISVQLKLAIQ